jgi:polysaccharide deacetylase 2 family uncharacterized protein YibQ
MIRHRLGRLIRAVGNGSSPIGLRGLSLLVLALLVLSVAFDWPPPAKPQWAKPARHATRSTPAGPVAATPAWDEAQQVPEPQHPQEPRQTLPATPVATSPAMAESLPTPRKESGAVAEESQEPALPSAAASAPAEPSTSAMPHPVVAAPPPAPRLALQEEEDGAQIGQPALVSPPPGPEPTGERTPAIAIIIDDLGVNVPATRVALRLPAPLTLSFLPYGYSLHAFGKEAHAAGDEVFLHLPMEPVGNVDPGPNALVEGLSLEEIRRRVAWALSRVPDADGVNNHMGSRLTSDPDAMMLVMGDLAGRGLVFVDSLTSAHSVAAATARSAGIPAATRDVFLDDDEAEPAIERQLAQLERLAREAGTAIAIGHPYPSTMDVLRHWLPQAKARGIRLVTVSSLIAIRTCGTHGLALSAACIVPVAGPPPARARPT